MEVAEKCGVKRTNNKNPLLQYLLDLRGQQLDGPISPNGVVYLNALSSCKGSRQLLNLIPLTQVL